MIQEVQLAIYDAVDIVLTTGSPVHQTRCRSIQAHRTIEFPSLVAIFQFLEIRSGFCGSISIRSDFCFVHGLGIHRQRSEHAKRYR